MLELAELIWKKVQGDEPFRYVSDKPYTYDVQRRVPDGREGAAGARLRGDDRRSREALDEIIPWIAAQIEIGGI